MNGAVCSRQVRVGSVPGLNHSRCVTGHHSFARSPLNASIVRLDHSRRAASSPTALRSRQPFEVELRPRRRGETAAGGVRARSAAACRSRTRRRRPGSACSRRTRRRRRCWSCRSCRRRARGRRVAHEPRRCRCRRPTQHRGDLIRVRRAEHRLGCGDRARARARCRRRPRCGARARRHPQPAVGERRVRRDQLERRHLDGAERDGRHRVERARDARCGAPAPPPAARRPPRLSRTVAAFAERMSARRSVMRPAYSPS